MATPTTATQTPEPAATPTVLATASPSDAGARPSVTGATPQPVVDTPTRAPTLAPPATPDDRSDPGRLLIPELKVTADIVVVPLLIGQWGVSQIIYDVGLLGNTAFPGRPGNAAISGHVSLKVRGDGPFRWLEKLAPGDEIVVQQRDTRYTYHVSQSKVVPPTDVSVLAQTDSATLTLITCSDWDFLKAEYGKRLMVTATLAGQRKTGTQGQRQA